ncbi:winged helix-turn-helix transcriptional regulator [Streptomyces sp. NPDC059575]|uniref:winged helix-turn-helix transcriptional regulator n=1 Tax=Streptomyces sp. NPDC059575 TaxID=3346872 RepID=UPI0036A79E08
MSAPEESPAFSIGSVDAQRVEDLLSLIAPKWTAWTAMTLTDGPMRVRDIATRLPFIHETFLSKRLATMHADGLITRTDDSVRAAPYQLTELGESLSPVHHALSDWSQAHLSLGAMAEAERVEDALRRLRPRHSTAMVQVLDANGAMRFMHIAEEVGLDHGFTRNRLVQLQADGLVTRTGPRHGDPYVLTNAGQTLGAVYASAEHWGEPIAVQRTSSAKARVTAATRTNTSVPLTADGARTAAALRRSAAPSALFSHAPQPQPRVPAAVTAWSAPGRGR